MTDQEFEKEVFKILQRYQVSEQESAPFMVLAYDSHHSDGNQAVLWEFQELLEAYLKALKARG